MTGRYVCHTIEFTVVDCQICILKETISRDFSKLSLDPQMDQKKTDMDEKKTAMVALLHSITHLKLE